MAKLDELVLELRATTDKLESGLRKANASLTQTQGKFKATEASAAKLSSQFKALAPLAAAVFSVATIKSIIDASAALQQLEARLTAATGSTEAATQAMTRLRQIAAEQKVDLLDLSDGFTRLLPAVKSGVLSYQELETLLRLTNDNIKAFGLSSGEAQGIFLGLSQTLSSGTVTTEDLRQVTDRMAGSMAAVAEAMNMSVGELKEYIATGTVAADEIVPALIEAFRKNEGAAASMANTWDSAVTDMKNNWRDFAAILGDTGILEAATYSLNTLTEALKLVSTVILKYRILWNELTGDTTEAARLQRRYNELIAEFTDMTSSATNELDKLTGKRGGGGMKNAAKEAEKAANNFEKLQGALDEMASAAQYESMSIGMSKVEKAVLDIDQAVEKLTNKYGKLTESQKKQVEELKKITKANIEHAEAMEAAEKQAEEYAEAMARPFETAVENIQNLITDTFEGIFDGSIDSAADAADAIKKIFIRMAAETATLELFGAQGLAGQVRNGGVSKSGSSQSGGVFDKIGSIESISDIGGVLSSGGLVTGLAGLAVDKIGESIGLDYTLKGAMIGGPLGLLAGGALDLIGGLFGGKPSSKMQTGLFEGGELTARGGLTGKKFSQENQDMVDALGATTSAIQEAFGVNSPLAIAASDRYGFEFAKTADLRIFDADSPLRQQFDTAGEFYRGFVDSILEETTRFSDAVVTAIQGIDFGTTEKQLETALQDLAFATIYDTLGQTEEAATVLGQVLEALNAQFDTAVESAERLGLSIEKVNQVREQEIQKLRDTATGAIQDEILAITDPSTLARRQEIDRYKNQLKELQSIGADTASAELLHRLKMQEINKQANAEQIQAAQRLASEFERVTESLERTLLALQLGADSALSPLEQLNLARQNFEETAALARLGNLDALQALPSAVKDFLGESRDFNASNAQFKEDFALATQTLQEAMTVSGRQATVQTQTAERLSSQTTTSDPAMLAALQLLAKHQAESNRITQESLLEVQKVA